MTDLREIKRRMNVASIFPSATTIIRLVGALLLEQNDEWAVTRALHGGRPEVQ